MPNELIHSDPAVMMGKPVIAGTRVTVEFILSSMADGESIEQILDEHPHLTRDGIRAALAYATELLRAQCVSPGARARE